jgi:transmembrane sensor
MTEGRPVGGDRHEDQAIAWLIRLSAGEAGADDWRGLETWLAADPAHLAAYTRVEMLWAEVGDQAQALKAALDARQSATILPFTPRKAPAKSPMFDRRWVGVAAVLALVLASGAFRYVQTRPVTYQTARGETRTIALSDGTHIDLNGASRLAVRYDGRARHVQMADAEALFDVSKDPARPFLIATGAQRIRVVGTAFDVVNHAGELTVTVNRGVVEVARTAANGEVSDAQRVPAGYRLTRRDGEAVGSITRVGADEAGAWREHRLVSHDRSLASIVDDLNRAFATPITVRGDAANLSFSGVLVLDDEDAVIARLKAFLPLDVDRSQAGFTLSSRS